MTKTYLQEKKIEDLRQNLNEKVSFLKKDENTFEDLLEILMDKNFVLDTKTLIELSFDKKETFSNIRTFLSIFMINLYPDEILSQKGEIEEVLIKMGKNLIGEYEVFLNNKENDFLKKYDEYLIFFNNWKKNDLNSLLLVLSSAHSDLTITKEKIKSSEYESEEENERARIWMGEIENQKRLIESSVRKIGGEEVLDKFLTGNFLLDLVNSEFKEQILVNLRKVYFEKLNLELENLDKEKPYCLVKLFKEIRDLLFKMVPSRSDLHSKWLRELNIEILEQKLDKESYYKLILSYFGSIYDIIRICESEERNEETDVLIEELKNVNDEEINSFILKSVEKIYEKIGDVFRDITNLRDRLENKN